MKPVIFATALATLLTPVVSRCSMDNRWCYWIGTAPFCESTKFKIGEIDETGKVLKAWTKDKDRADLCTKFNHDGDRPSTSCCNDYGSSCWSGYKRLWCEVDEMFLPTWGKGVPSHFGLVGNFFIRGKGQRGRGPPTIIVFVKVNGKE